MKNLLLFIILLAANVANCQLEKNAQLIKQDYPDGYNLIRYYAVQEWGNDHEMVVYQINNQCDALVSIVRKFEPKHSNTIYRALQLWSYPTFLEHTQKYFEKEVTAATLEQLIYFHVDWEMVEYEYDNQVQAMESY